MKREASKLIYLIILQEQRQESCCCGIFPKLSMMRIKSYLGLCVASALVSFGAWLSFGKWLQFGVLFSLANIIGLTAGCVLRGPRKQLQVVFSPEQGPTSTVYILLIALTLLSALYIQSPFLVVVFCWAQYLAFIWYQLGFIPGAQQCIGRCCEMLNP